MSTTTIFERLIEIDAVRRSATWSFLTSEEQAAIEEERDQLKLAASGEGETIDLDQLDSMERARKQAIANLQSSSR